MLTNHIETHELLAGIDTKQFLTHCDNDSRPGMTSVKRCTVTILGVQIDNITVENAVASVEEMIESHGQHLIVPVNPEMIMAAQTNIEFRQTINNASLVLPDGIGVILASRLYRKPISSRIPGADLAQRLASLAQQRGLRMFFLGAGEGVAQHAARKLQAQYPGLIIAGTYAGSPHPDEEREICQRINDAHPHILLVAYGAPKQELWLARNLHKLQVPVAMCVGGTFDFIAGEVSRAPHWIQNIGFEWLYRLLKEPRRWRRMLALPRFAVAVLINIFRNKA